MRETDETRWKRELMARAIAFGIAYDAARRRGPAPSTDPLVLEAKRCIADRRRVPQPVGLESTDPLVAEVRRCLANRYRIPSRVPGPVAARRPTPKPAAAAVSIARAYPPRTPALSATQRADATRQFCERLNVRDRAQREALLRQFGFAQPATAPTGRAPGALVGRRSIVEGVPYA